MTRKFNCELFAIFATFILQPLNKL